MKFVIDADVGRAAANPDRVALNDQTLTVSALRSYLVLQATIAFQHSVVFSPRIWAEWERHCIRPLGAQRFLAELMSRGLMEMVPESTSLAAFEVFVCRHLPSDEHQAAKKDIHLVASALTDADQRLLSNDTKFRRRAVRLVPHEVAGLEFSYLYWAVPAEGGVDIWLAQGAPDDLSFRLNRESTA